MTPLFALLIAGGTIVLTHPSVELDVLGWSSDGAVAGFERSYQDGIYDYTIRELDDAEGHPLHAFRAADGLDSPDGSQVRASDYPALIHGFLDPFNKAEAASAGEAFLAAHPLDGVVSLKALPLDGSTVAVKHERGTLLLRLEQGKPNGKGCAPLTLQGSLAAGIFVQLFRDECLPPDGAMQDIDQRVSVAWSPDKQRLAIAWTVLRPLPGGKYAPGALPTRSQGAVLQRTQLATVDLLDAGAGPRLAALRSEIGRRFNVAHEGKALKARAATVVYFAPGFDAEAQALAKLAGGTAQPLEFKTPFALTLAAAP